ncbi:MAG: hypothetical protein BWK73_09215 [Thiothrix lacustris]|uniref:Uncharacterized protein n=1 Tax=Thiothrix lacustris TaxID=525917 RepID=A0A1Y1QV41_9GAMM|nr:MAG: hypothetical protein BWK73_09215 [Thiothrix lacustris]
MDEKTQAELVKAVADLTKAAAELALELRLVKLTLGCTIPSISRREFAKNVRYILDDPHVADNLKERLTAFTGVKKTPKFFQRIFGF